MKLEESVITEDFVKKISGCPSFAPHFHLSLQSGSDTVLKRMNRHYTAETFAKKVKLLKDTFEPCAVTTDVIVGFAGETDEEFEESLEFVKNVGFTQTHVFKYSRRKGTVADKMPDQEALAEVMPEHRTERRQSISAIPSRHRQMV